MYSTFKVANIVFVIVLNNSLPPLRELKISHDLKYKIYFYFLNTELSIKCVTEC